MTTKGDKTLADLDERQRKLYDLLVGTYKMKPRRAFLAVCGADAAEERKVAVTAPPWAFGQADTGWVLTCQRCNLGLRTDRSSLDDAARAAVHLGWKATVHVVRCPTCRASLR